MGTWAECKIDQLLVSNGHLGGMVRAKIKKNLQTHPLAVLWFPQESTKAREDVRFVLTKRHRNGKYVQAVEQFCGFIELVSRTLYLDDSSIEFLATNLTRVENIKDQFDQPSKIDQLLVSNGHLGGMVRAKIKKNLQTQPLAVLWFPQESTKAREDVKFVLNKRHRNGKFVQVVEQFCGFIELMSRTLVRIVYGNTIPSNRPDI
ncbi:hypothetical protein ACOME3_002828 [Neoechinorhynchus agilis]